MTLKSRLGVTQGQWTFDRLHRCFYSSSTVTMVLSCTISGIKQGKVKNCYFCTPFYKNNLLAEMTANIFMLFSNPAGSLAYPVKNLLFMHSTCGWMEKQKSDLLYTGNTR